MYSMVTIVNTGWYFKWLERIMWDMKLIWPTIFLLRHIVTFFAWHAQSDMFSLLSDTSLNETILVKLTYLNYLNCIYTWILIWSFSIRQIDFDCEDHIQVKLDVFQPITECIQDPTLKTSLIQTIYACYPLTFKSLTHRKH